MKERFNIQIEKELPSVMRQAVRQHPLKKLFQEEEARIRQGASSGNLPPSESAGGADAKVIPLWRRLTAVAAVLLFAGFSGYYVWQEYFVEPPLYLSLIIPPQAVVQADKIDEQNFLDGKEAYTQKKYKRAIANFQNIPASAPYFHEAQFLLAHAYHYEGEFSKAIPIYRSFLENNGALMGRLRPENQLEDNLRCNLVLALWGNNQLEQARSELKLLKALPTISKKVKENIAIIEQELK